jgi:hypothetical protein
MAFSSTIQDRNYLGNLAVEIHSWNAASVTTGTISTGLSSVLHISSNNLVTEDVGKWTSSGGVVTVSGVTSNDTGTVMVYGRV